MSIEQADFWIRKHVVEKHAEYIKIHRPEAYIDVDINDKGIHAKSSKTKHPKVIWKLNMIINSTPRVIKLGAQNLFAQFEKRYIQPGLPTDPIIIIIMLRIYVFVWFEKRLLKTNTLLQVTETSIIKEKRVLLSKYINKIKLKLIKPWKIPY